MGVTQDTVSKTANALQISEDIAQSFLAIATAGESAQYSTCIQGVLEGFFPPAEVASLALNPSASALLSYLKEVLFSPVRSLRRITRRSRDVRISAPADALAPGCANSL